MVEDPLALFDQWYAEAKGDQRIVDASAMALATADRAGRPSVRIVLLKQSDAAGFVFYTNLNSPKAQQLEENAEAELCFHWAPLAKQVRIHGTVEAVEPAEADAYFATRPRLSRIGAWASQQSQPMRHRWELEMAVTEATLRFATGDVPRPPRWSGFRVVPTTLEFWHERPFRLHERRLFRRESGAWRCDWLYP